MELYIAHPYAEVTLQMLLDTLALNPATFYRYFEDKDAFYLYLNQKLMQRLRAFERARQADGDDDPLKYYSGSEMLSPLELRFSEIFWELPQDILLRGYFQVFKDESFADFKGTLRQLRLKGQLHNDIDEELLAFMYATSMFNMILFFREFGVTDRETQEQLKRNYYSGFFRRGLLKETEKKEE
jgi:AcrR family transcriptional regulator